MTQRDYLNHSFFFSPIRTILEKLGGLLVYALVFLYCAGPPIRMTYRAVLVVTFIPAFLSKAIATIPVVPFHQFYHSNKCLVNYNIQKKTHLSLQPPQHHCVNWYIDSFSKPYKAPKAMAIETEMINIGLQVSQVDETQRCT